MLFLPLQLISSSLKFLELLEKEPLARSVSSWLVDIIAIYIGVINSIKFCGQSRALLIVFGGVACTCSLTEYSACICSFTEYSACTPCTGRTRPHSGHYSLVV